MLKSEQDHLSPPTYLPCWKCYGHKPFPERELKWEGDWVFHEERPVYCFTLNQTLVPAAQEEDVECPLHGRISIEHIAPDLVRYDHVQFVLLYTFNSIYVFSICECRNETFSHTVLLKKLFVS